MQKCLRGNRFVSSLMAALVRYYNEDAKPLVVDYAPDRTGHAHNGAFRQMGYDRYSRTARLAKRRWAFIDPDAEYKTCGL